MTTTLTHALTHVWQLGQSSTPPSGGSQGDIVFWCSVLMAAVVVLFAIAALAKRRSQEWQQHDTGIKLSFTLDDVRQMHAAGQLSDEEAERMRAKIIAKSREGVDSDDDADVSEEAAVVAGTDNDTSTPLQDEHADDDTPSPGEAPPAPVADRDASIARPTPSVRWLNRGCKRPPGPRPVKRRRRRCTMACVIPHHRRTRISATESYRGTAYRDGWFCRVNQLQSLST